MEWIDSYFTKSLAYIQAQYYEDITGDEVLDFIKARIKGITKKVGIEKKYLGKYCIFWYSNQFRFANR